MREKLLNKKLKGDIGAGTLYLVAIIIGLVGFGTVMTRGVVPPNTTPAGDAVTPVLPSLDAGKKNLQLYTFGYTTPNPTPIVTTPPPPTSCPIDNLKTPGCGSCHNEFEALACDEPTCDNGLPKMPLALDPSHKEYCLYIDANDHELYQKKLSDPKCVGACVAKPVIYLYPTMPTLVDAKVTVPGKIIASDPIYPMDGWKNVLAQPNGSLTYQSENYNELFFESDVDKVNAPKDGIVIAKKDLKEKLTDATYRLGLVGAEQKEFLDYWLPVLNKLDAPYILFSIVDPSEKERIDNVSITPKPDTFIAFIAYFKPLKNQTSEVLPMGLPEKPPQRIGFTAVEWGGTIDY